MATRSFIAYSENDSTYKAVYCHWDGYPDGVGKVLSEHYRDPEKVTQLIAKGDMAVLDPTLEKTEFYTKRGERLTITKADNLEELKEKAKTVWAEYLYIFVNETKTWLCFDLY